MPQFLQDWWASFHAKLDLVLVLGFVGQAIFFTRFLVQWIASEKAGRSVIPVAFWWISLGGAALLFVYAILRADPVFIVGQSLGSFIYIRNLILIRRQKRTSTPGPAA